MKIGKGQAKFLVISCLSIIAFATHVQAVTLNEKCVVNILNRTIQVSADGGWALPNVPSNMGQIRARATCTLDDGRTVSGQSDYFNVIRNGQTKAGDITFEAIDPIPSAINFSTTDTLLLSEVDETFALTVTGFYADNQVKNISAADSGINYSSTNTSIVTVDDNGLVTAKANGIALVSARKDGVLASRRVEVSLGGDLDKDGIPDEVERALGLNPNDPIDALEDQDNDGLSAIEEYQAGTNIFNADTDGDGINDLEELTLGTNGIITNPLLADSDGDGIADGLEILGGSNPNDSTSGDLAEYLDFIVVTPTDLSLTYNTIDGEASAQLAVTGYMLDGSPVDLTDQASGTRYRSEDITKASFGLSDGQIFAGQTGDTQITVTNGDKSFTVDVNISEFEPVAQSAIAIPGYANNVDVQGNLAYIAAGNAGLQIVDVSDKTSPEIIASLNTGGLAIDVKVRNNTVYLADGTSGLQIIDVTDPTEPRVISTVDTAGVAQDITIQGDFAFVADGIKGVEIINIANSESSFSVAYTDAVTDVKGIAVEGNNLVVVAGSALTLFDIENKNNPIKLTSVNIGLVKDVAINNGYVTVAAYSTGYRVYKITEAKQLELKGGDRTFVPRDVAATNGFLFFAEQLFPNVVAYVNVKDNDNPFFQDTINLSPLGDYAGTGIAVDATHAYITEEAFVVGSDYKATGNSKLFIAQYRQLIDENGIAPTVALTQPDTDGVTVEGERLSIAADARDDIAIAKVEFYVNNFKVGQDTTFPYSLIYTVPADAQTIAIRADAIDLAGTITKSSLMTLAVQNDEDGDGLGDIEEANVWFTDVNIADTDNDGLLDGEEIARGTDPNDKDTDNDGLEDGAEVENETDPLNSDITAPVVTSTEPSENATAVAENSAIIINFSEEISQKSISATSITVLESGLVEVAGTIRLIGGGQQLLFTPTALMKDYTAHSVIVNGIKDLAGNPIAEDYTFSFETGNTVDTVRPTISSVNPSAHSTNVPVNAALTVVMSERINPETFTPESFYVRDNSTGAIIDGIIDVKDDSQTITFTPNAAFLVGRQHRIYLTSAIKDLFGNSLYNTNYYFTTAFEADGIAPLIEVTNIQDQQSEIPLNATLKIKFDEAVNSYTIKNTKLFKNGEEVLVERSVSTDLKLFTLTPIINLEANAEYSLIIDGTADLSGNLLEQARNITFTTGSATDTQIGSIVSHSPAANAADVPLNAMITIDINEAVAPTSLNGSTVRIYNQTEVRDIDGEISLSDDGKRVQFSPEGGLTAGHQYRALISYSPYML
ncbi:Ig-like domain-containing protein, partial [Colwelliaceae bacterium MEBiC 14330]